MPDTKPAAGYEAAKAMRDKLAKEKSEEGIKLNQEAESVLAQVSLTMSDKLQNLYKENVGIGTEGIGTGNLPILKIKQEGKGQYLLADGSKPTPGWYYYSPTKEQFQTIKCHVLVVSRGYYAKPLPPSKDPKYNQIMGGVIVDGAETKPFLMFLNGKKLTPTWDFMRETMRPFTSKLPMFSMLIEMGSTQVETAYDPTYVPTYKLMVDDNNSPLLVSDEGLFVFLRDNVPLLEDYIDNLIKIGQSDDYQADAEAVPIPTDDDNHS